MASYVVDDRELKRSLNLNIFASTFGMVFFTVIGNPIGSAVFNGFMTKLGAGDLIYSIVLALPVLGGMSQIIGSYLVETTGKRKFIFLSCGLVHRVLWIPVALIPILLKSEPRQAIIWSITIMITISSVASSLNNVAFNSWMGALVPSDIIGRFFGMRTLVSTASATATALAIGLIVDKINDLNGFAIVFAGGALFGISECIMFIFIKHPPLPPPKVKQSFRSMMAEPLKNKNYMLFVLFATAYSFAVNVSGPFFNTYMLQDLNMNYFMINLSCVVMSGLSTILCVRYWGVLADRYGNKPVVFLSSVLIAIVPIFWMLSTPTNFFMIFVANILAGIGWSGYNLAIFNHSVWLAPEQNRSAYTAYYTLFTSAIGTALAYVCGGLFMQAARPYFKSLHMILFTGAALNAFYILLIISMAIRVLAIAVFYNKYTEENAKPVHEMLTDIHTRIKGIFF